MNGDYSRLTFDPSRNYSGVRMQQGRVLLDSAWNEQAELLNRRARAAIIDTFGRLHVASPEAFAISLGPGGLMIGGGRIYVDGLIAENHGAGRLAWDPALDELRGEEPTPYVRQPYLLDPPPVPASAGRYLIYLDVWQREVTTLEDPGLTDPAVGSDTTTRLQTVWQVRILGDARASANPLERIPAFAPSGVWLTAEIGPGGYTGAENQLYRVEIHDGGEPGRATFKWSRESAAIAARVRILGPAQLLLDRAVERFATGDWIEITDDRRELTGIPGEMRRIKGIDGSTVALATALTNRFSDSARIRRWDQKEHVGEAGVLAVRNDRRIELEDGISISFGPADGVFRPGDYWVTPARTADKSIVPLREAPSRGIHHHYAELALFTPPGTIVDRRRRTA